MAGFEYPVDVVLVIDSTSSMRNIIERVKHRALHFHDDLRDLLKKEQKHISTLRVKVIATRDFYVDGARSIEVSPFFSLPAEQDKFASFIGGIDAIGGGDEPETTLEALAIAMQSDWVGGIKKRHVIVVWTDASAHPLEKDAGSKPSNYPASMPRNFDELTDMWEGQAVMDHSAKRLVIYAPPVYPWPDIYKGGWNWAVHHPSLAGEGLSDFDYDTILSVISESV